MVVHMSVSEVRSYVTYVPSVLEKWKDHVDSCTSCQSRIADAHPDECCLRQYPRGNSCGGAHDDVVERWGRHIEGCPVCREAVLRFEGQDC